MLKGEWNGGGGPGALSSMERGLYLDILLIAGAPEFLVTPLLMGGGLKSQSGPACMYLTPNLV